MFKNLIKIDIPLKMQPMLIKKNIYYFYNFLSEISSTVI